MTLLIFSSYLPHSTVWNSLFFSIKQAVQEIHCFGIVNTARFCKTHQNQKHASAYRIYWLSDIL